MMMTTTKVLEVVSPLADDIVFPRINLSPAWSFRPEDDDDDDAEEEEEGFECFPDDDRVDTLSDYDLTEEFSTPKKQLQRLLQVVRRLFRTKQQQQQQQQQQQGNTNGGKSSIKIKLVDDASVASTAASTVVCPSTLSSNLDDFATNIDVIPITHDNDDDDDVAIRHDEVMTPNDDDDNNNDALLKVLRVFLEYESEKYASIERGFEIVIPGVSCDDDDLQNDSSLMQRRLLKTGLVKNRDFEFVTDHVSKEVNPTAEELKKAYEEKNVTHVKTGVWQVTILDDDNDDDNEGTILSSSNTNSFYVVTGVSMEDRVDTKKLRKAIFSSHPKKGRKPFQRRPKLSIAPTNIAEELTGYKSGTMAPICHSKPMQLFLEESIPIKTKKNHHRLKCGSGIFGTCLSISADKFLEIAQANPKGIKTCPLIQKKKKKKKKETMK